MPIRTYSGIDLINYLLTDISTHSFVGTSGSSSLSVTPGSQGIAVGIGNANAIVTAFNGIEGLVDIRYDITGDFDFDVFPSIPSNALITSIRVKVENSCSGTAVGTSVGNSIHADIIIQNFIEVALGNLLSDLEVDTSDTAGSALSVNLAHANSMTFSTEQELILSPPITKAQLVSSFSNIKISISCQVSCNSSGAGVTSGNITLDASADLDNFQMIVTYESGPEVGITLVPSGGNVEVGEIVNITSDTIDLSELEFMIAHDTDSVAPDGYDNVIPVKPKVIGPGEVEIEIPPIADEPCLDCFGDCPDCVECYDLCAEDILSDACLAAIDLCFDCVELCLEDTELTEECLGSVMDPPTDTPEIVIIVKDPTGTQFIGNVPLGNFIILVANGSGIYRLVNGKTNDTLYRSTRNGTTYDVKIPNPFGKTGFFRN